MVGGIVDSLLACLGETVGNGDMAGPCDIGGMAVPKLPWSGGESPASIAGRSLGVMMEELGVEVAAGNSDWGRQINECAV